MKLHILFAHRKEGYPGEFAPEALEIADEYTMDENPNWLQGKIKEHENDSSIAKLAVVIVKIPDTAVEEALYPTQQEIIGTVVN